MTTLERVEANLLAITEAQISWQKDIRRAMDGLVEAHTLSQTKLETLMESTSKYVDSSAEFVTESKARTMRLKENLDALTRAITAEHSTSKKQQKILRCVRRQVNSADILYLVIESVKGYTKHMWSSTAHAPVDGAEGSSMF